MGFGQGFHGKVFLSTESGNGCKIIDYSLNASILKRFRKEEDIHKKGRVDLWNLIAESVKGLDKVKKYAMILNATQLQMQPIRI